MTPMINVFRREFVQFGVTFGLVFYAWSGALGNGQEILSVIVGAIAGVIGGLRGLLLLSAYRRQFGLSHYSSEELKAMRLDRPSDW